MLLLAPLLLSPVQEPVTAPVTETAPELAVRQDVTGTNALSMSFAGMERLFVDPRDQGLLDFLLDTVDRLPEFATTGGWDAEAPVDQIQLVARIMMSPWDLAVDYSPNAMPFPVSGHWHFHAESVDALREDETLLLEFLRQAGVEVGEPEISLDGLRPILADDALGGFDVRFGTLEDSQSGSIALSVNEAESGRTANIVPFLPSHVDHAFSMHIRASAFMDMFNMTCTSPMVPPVLRGMCDLAAELKVDYSIGHGEEASQSTMRLRNLIPLLRDLELLDEQPLAIEDLSLIPRDATSAAMIQVDPKGVLVLVSRLAQAMGKGDRLARLLEEDDGDIKQLINDLGNTFGTYSVQKPIEADADLDDLLGLPSMVVFFEFENKDRANAALPFIRQTVDRTISTEGPYIAQPVFRVENGFLFICWDEEVADRAVAQARDRGNSLLSRPELLAALGGVETDLMMLMWEDTPRLAELGYETIREFAEMASGFMDQVAIEMPVNRIFPAKEVLLDGARPKITTVSREIDDLAAYSVSDRSILLKICALGGQSGIFKAASVLGESLGNPPPPAEWEASEEATGEVEER